MWSGPFWDNLFELVWAPRSWIKAIVLAVTFPLWLPIVRALLREVLEVLAPTGGTFGLAKPRPMRPRPPGEDPFLNIPLAGRRRGPGTLTEPARELVPARRSGSAPAPTLRRGARSGPRTRA
jgi:hypothetical protein